MVGVKVYALGEGRPTANERTKWDGDRNLGRCTKGYQTKDERHDTDIIVVQRGKLGLKSEASEDLRKDQSLGMTDADSLPR
jgi:hypothetical protein